MDPVKSGKFGDGAGRVGPLSYAALAVVFVGLCCAHTLFAATDITVLLVDAKSGKPLEQAAVTLTVSENGKVIFRSHSNTNSKGVAVLRLPETIPERINLSYSTPNLGSCSDIGFPTSEILTAGLISKNRCYGGKLPRPMNATRGEIVLFGGPVPLGERIRREIP